MGTDTQAARRARERRGRETTAVERHEELRAPEGRRGGGAICKFFTASDKTGPFL
jgi:hypothetical protein